MTVICIWKPFPWRDGGRGEKKKHLHEEWGCKYSKVECVCGVNGRYFCDCGKYEWRCDVYARKCVCEQPGEDVLARLGRCRCLDIFWWFFFPLQQKGKEKKPFGDYCSVKCRSKPLWTFNIKARSSVVKYTEFRRLSTVSTRSFFHGRDCHSEWKGTRTERFLSAFTPCTDQTDCKNLTPFLKAIVCFQKPLILLTLTLLPY